MKVLVTGATGFIGSRLVEKLVKRGVSVTCLARHGTITNPDVKTVNGDLTYPDFTFPDDRYDVAYHLAAAWPGEKDKRVLQKVNYDGAVNLFSLIKEKVKFFIYISGLGAFGDPKGSIINEESSLNPNTNYAKIRIDTQKYLESSCQERGIEFAVAYLGDVYGNGGWFKNILMNRIIKGSFRIPGSGQYYRSFVHVDDVTSALIAIAEKNAINQSFIITDSNPAHFKDFVNFVCDQVKEKHPAAIPTFLAKVVLGADFVNLLTISIKASNAKIAKLCDFVYKSYQEGIPSVLDEMKS